MVKRRNMKNKKGKRKGGGVEDGPHWKQVRDMYNPIHNEILPEPELEDPPSVKNVSVPHRKSPRSRIPRNTQTIKGEHWSERPVDSLTLGNINDGYTDSGVEPNPDKVFIVEETKRETEEDSRRNKKPADWATASPGSLHKLLRGRNKGGGSRRKYKLSKKKQKRKYTKRRKSGKRKSSRRKYTKRR